jgi:N-acetylglutamate synthase-like GNAT family acetyltransferase
MIARKATVLDIPEILDLVRAFIAESDWGWTYNQDNSIKTLTTYIMDDDSDVFVVGDKKAGGFATVAFDNNFHSEKVGSIVKFYIHPDFRKTTAARELTSACVQWFKDAGCSDDFVEATGNIKSQSVLFENLMKKFGYQPFGCSLHRRTLNV